MTRTRAALAALLLAVGCDTPRAPPFVDTDAGASPNASILPAPLANDATDLPNVFGLDAGVRYAFDEIGRRTLPDAGAPGPIPLPSDKALPVESPMHRELSGVVMEAAFRFRDVPQPLKASEVAIEGIRAAQKLTSLTWRIDLAEVGRMRVQFTSRAFPLPEGSELRAQRDFYGALLLWPDLTVYRLVPAGALRTLLGERRVDVTPLSSGSSRPVGEGRRLGFSVRKVEISASLGVMELELGKVPEAGEGGPLLCRALLEILGVDPRSPECVAGEVPLSASYAWQGGGGIRFEITSVSRRTDLAPSDLLMPPPGPSYAASGLPTTPGNTFLTRDELAAFRTEPLPSPPSADPGAPHEGLFAVNQTEMLAYLLVDGVPVVAVPPVSERYVLGPPRGVYVIQWRTFLGESIAPPQIVELPARLVHSRSSGAPEGG